MCDSATNTAGLRDDLGAILEAIDIPAADPAVLEKRAGYATAMLRAILATDLGTSAPPSAAQLRARLAHPRVPAELAAA
jgi:hypothetical protein